MTVRQTLILLITLVVVVATAGLIGRVYGQLPGAVTLVALSIIGGLLNRYLNNRDLDRDRVDPTPPE